MPTAFPTNFPLLSINASGAVPVSDKSNFALSTIGVNAVADAVLSRDVSNVEATAPEHSLAFLVLAATESTSTVGGGDVWTVYRTDGITVFAAKTLATDAAANPIVGVS
jgi:hypothetical protein